MIKINEDDEDEEFYEQFTSKPEPCAECVSDCEYDGIEYALAFFVENGISYCTYCGSVL